MSVVVCRWMNDVTRTRSHRNGCPVEYTWFQWTGANLNIAAPCSRHTRSQIYFKSGYNFSFLISSPCSVKRQWKSMLKTSLSTMFNTVSFVWPLFNPLYGPLVSRPGPPCNTAGAPCIPVIQNPWLQSDLWRAEKERGGGEVLSWGGQGGRASISELDVCTKLGIQSRNSTAR